MPTEHTIISYKFAELGEAAQAKAVEIIAEKLGGDWWDQNDTDTVGEAIRYEFAGQLGLPDAFKYGPGDFPGIPGITLDSWDVDRGSIGFTGQLTRENAPAPAWPNEIESVRLDSHWNRGTDVATELKEGIDFDCARCGQKASVLVFDPSIMNHVGPNGFDDPEADADHKPTLRAGTLIQPGQAERLTQDVRDAMSAALSAGRLAAEYIGSEESARDWIESNDPDFYLDGRLF